MATTFNEAPRTAPLSPAPERLYSGPHLVAFVAMWLLAQLGILLIRSPSVLDGAQIDTDGYMRLVRLRLLLDGGGWFDGTIPRSNWPFGEVHHWTRPLDVLLMVLAAPLRAFMDTDAAVAVAGAIVSPLCHLAICVAAVWLVRPLVPGPERFFAMPAMLAQPGLIGYGTAGRADHHALIFLLAALALGAWIRALLAPQDRRWPVLAGVFSGLGIWVSPESLLPLALLFASGGIAWVLRGDGLLPPNRRLCLGLAATLAGAILLERPPGEWLAQEFDRISAGHVTMSLIALAFWLAMARLPFEGAGWRGRLAGAFTGGTFAVALLALLHPRFFHGPWEGVDPGIIAVWLHGVNELQPLYPKSWEEFGVLVRFIGPVLFLLPVAALWLRQDFAARIGPVRVLLLLSLLAYVPLAMHQRRFAGYVGIAFAVLMTELIARLLGRADRIGRPLRRSMVRVAAILAVLMGATMAGYLVEISMLPAPPVEAATVPHDAGTAALDDDADTPPSRGCSLTGLAPALADPRGLGAEPRTVAAFIDYGPELLYRTPHRVLAGPYHRNAGGILAAFRLLSSPEPAVVDSIVRTHQVDMILICPPRDSLYFGRSDGVSLYDELVAGTPPPWLRAVALPADAPGGFRLFEVVR